MTVDNVLGSRFQGKRSFIVVDIEGAERQLSVVDLVVDVDQAYFAVVGENLMKFAQQNNYAGIIVNGYVRDTFQIIDIPVVLRAVGTCPRKYIPTTNGDRNVRLSFGGIDFNSGDYLYADTDGVIVATEKIV